MGALVAQLASQRTPELMAAVILSGAFDPDDKVPDHPEPVTPARTPTTAEDAAEDFRAPGVISRRAIDAYVRAALAADPVRADWRHDTEWWRTPSRTGARPVTHGPISSRTSHAGLGEHAGRRCADAPAPQAREGALSSRGGE